MTLRQGPRGERERAGERDEREDGHDGQSPVAPLGGSPLRLELATVTPGEHRRREHVVEDLVARRSAAAAGDATEDPRRVQGAEHRVEPLRLDPGVPRQIIHGVGDLGA